MIYKFDTLEITDPEITVYAVRDVVKEFKCEVEVMLKSSNTIFTTTLYHFEYEESWEDNEVYEWVMEKLQEYVF
jgi:hypothetical protein